jgi:hypothetical protein
MNQEYILISVLSKRICPRFNNIKIGDYDCLICDFHIYSNSPCCIGCCNAYVIKTLKEE